MDSNSTLVVAKSYVEMLAKSTSRQRWGRPFFQDTLFKTRGIDPWGVYSQWATGVKYMRRETTAFSTGSPSHTGSARILPVCGAYTLSLYRRAAPRISYEECSTTASAARAPPTLALDGLDPDRNLYTQPLSGQECCRPINSAVVTCPAKQSSAWSARTSAVISSGSTPSPKIKMHRFLEDFGALRSKNSRPRMTLSRNATEQDLVNLGVTITNRAA